MNNLKVSIWTCTADEARNALHDLRLEQSAWIQTNPGSWKLEARLISVSDPQVIIGSVIGTVWTQDRGYMWQVEREQGRAAGYSGSKVSAKREVETVGTNILRREVREIRERLVEGTWL